MTEIIKWCNSNSGFIMAILTLSIVIVTLLQYFLIKYGNKLNRETIARTSRPFIIVDIIQEQKYLYLRLTNHGMYPAVNISLEFNEKFEIFNKKSFSILGNIPVIGPSKEYIFFLHDVNEFRKKNKHISKINAKISYNGIFPEENYIETVFISLDNI